MVSLQRVLTGNPFEQHPVLRTIFAGDRGQHVEQDTVDDLAKGTADLYRNHVYLICDAGGTVVGITGFFQLGVGSGAHDTLALRWHGVAPAHRGRGLSEQGFAAVCKEALQVHPHAARLVELVPMADADNANALIAYFERLGFRRDGAERDAKTFPEAAALPGDSGNWQAMVFQLKPKEPVHWVGKGIV